MVRVNGCRRTTWGQWRDCHCGFGADPLHPVGTRGAADPESGLRGDAADRRHGRQQDRGRGRERPRARLAEKLLATLRATYGSADTGYGYWPAISGHPFVVPNPALAGASATALPNAYGLGMKAVRLGINDTLTYPAQQATKITVFYARTMFSAGPRTSSSTARLSGRSTLPAPKSPGAPFRTQWRQGAHQPDQGHLGIG